MIVGKGLVRNKDDCLPTITGIGTNPVSMYLKQYRIGPWLKHPHLSLLASQCLPISVQTPQKHWYHRNLRFKGPALRGIRRTWASNSLPSTTHLHCVVLLCRSGHSLCGCVHSTDNSWARKSMRRTIQAAFA